MLRSAGSSTPTPGLRADMLKRAYDVVLKAAAVVAGLMILFLMVSISADVVGRYFWNRPIGWALEVAEHILLYIPFLGMAWLVRRREGHVRIDVVLQAFRPRAQMAITMVVSIAVAVACAIGAYWSAVATLDHFERNVMTVGIYPVPKFTLLWVLALGFTLTAIEFLRKGLNEYRQLHGDSPGDERGESG